MYDGRIRRLRFTLSNGDLEAAIDLLSSFYPPVLHQRAWDIMMSEAERRQDGEAPLDIEMASGVFDTLPSVVQALLCHHVSANPRRAA
jgi:hypothetical protein